MTTIADDAKPPGTIDLPSIQMEIAMAAEILSDRVKLAREIAARTEPRFIDMTEGAEA